MAFIDYYKIMGIPKDTPQKDIRAAYTRRAKQFHPDLHPDDPKAKAKFQALNEAYDVLNDPEKRRKYDQYGENWKHAEEFEAQRNQQQSQRGGGFGGCTINLVKDSLYDEFIERAVREYAAQYGHEPKVYPVIISEGARRLE